MLTHTDDDCVVELVDLFEELVTEAAHRQPPTIGVHAVWMNSSVPNRSTIMFVTGADGKRALFTRDGRGDYVVQGLIRKSVK